MEMEMGTLGTLGIRAFSSDEMGVISRRDVKVLFLCFPCFPLFFLLLSFGHANRDSGSGTEF